MRFTTSIDYLRLVHSSLHTSVVESLDDWLKVFFCTTLDYASSHPVKCGRLFQNHVTTECGSGVFNYNVRENGSFDSMIEFRGGLLKTLHPAQLRELLQLLLGYGFRCTRIDLCIDDYDKVLDFGVVQEALRAGNIKYFRSGTSISGWGDDSGATIYFGKRGSDRCGRLYDKSIESGGEMDCYRLEAELKGNQAVVAFSNLSLSTLELADWVGLVSSVCLGVFDFVDRSFDEKVERCPRLTWWEKFCNYFPGHVRYRVHRHDNTVQQTREWFGRSVVVALATIKEAVGHYDFNKWLASMMSDGLGRMSSRHWKRVETYQYRHQVDNWRTRKPVPAPS